MLKRTLFPALLLIVYGPAMARAEYSESPEYQKFSRVEKWVGTISVEETIVGRKKGGQYCDWKVYDHRSTWSCSLKGELVQEGTPTNGWIFRYNEPGGS